jgi:two-component system response regulator PilR (NtrC family)
MPGMSGIEALEQMVNICPESCFIMITAYGTIETAVEAFRKGASDYIMKPLIIEDVVNKIERYLEHRNMVAEVRRLRRLVHREEALERLLGDSKPMKQLHGLIESVSQTDSTVLLTGESGTGKELVARAIHERFATPGRPFMAVNCAAISEHLFESELFGHIKGAFTGADTDREGFFTAADGGTLFLDEVSEIPPALQAKLLRVIETKEVVAVGSTRGIPINARIISSTNQDLVELTEKGKFRQDLLYRLRVIEIRLPTLRERLEDIPLLAEHFVGVYNKRLKRNFLGLNNEAIRCLMAYPWPGNVRELENVIERAMILGRGEFINVEDLPIEVTGSDYSSGVSRNLKEAVKAFERGHISRVLKETGGNKEEAARRMGINPATLYRKLADLSI